MFSSYAIIWNALKDFFVFPSFLGTEGVPDQYLESTAPPVSPPPILATPKRPSNEWERDRIELAEMEYAKELIRSKNFPPYFDTQEGTLLVIFVCIVIMLSVKLIFSYA